MATARDNPDFRMLNQYENEANVEAHYKTTGPEIWKQTAGKVTHFVSSLGTCGTITGTGRFLKEKRRDVKVLGVHPQEGHDIPGVRSLKQLVQTKLFRPKEYDGTIEITNREAYDLCRRLNQEESVIAGPSSGMALAGALKLVPDEPGVVVVVMFPDNIFKYASSVARHFPKLAPAAPKQGDGWMEKLMEAARNRFNTIEADEVAREQAMLVDVRPPHVYLERHVRGAVNLPLEEIVKRAAELPADREAPIVTICNRGNASLAGLVVIKALGYRNVRSLNGGTIGWTERGFPTE